MLAYREWRVRLSKNDIILYSSVWPVPWPNVTMTADGTPTVDNCRGLHAYAPWSEKAFSPDSYPGDSLIVIGAVDVYGIIQIHEDGVLRSEHARILALRVVPPRHGHHIAIHRWTDAAYCECRGDGNELFNMSAQKLEEMLLQRYNVSRLPDGVGPWPTPFGARKVMKK